MDINVSQIAVIDLIIDKENRKYQLLVPFGAPWDEAFQTIEEFKLAVQEMKKIQEERMKEMDEEKQPEEVTAEIVQ